jgi:hypothetical protein
MVLGEIMPDEKRDQAIGQFRLQLNGVFAPFVFYGQEPYIDQAQKEVLKLALALHDRLNGKDVPIIK